MRYLRVFPGETEAIRWPYEFDTLPLEPIPLRSFRCIGYPENKRFPDVPIDHHV